MRMYSNITKIHDCNTKPEVAHVKLLFYDMSHEIECSQILQSGQWTYTFTTHQNVQINFFCEIFGYKPVLFPSLTSMSFVRVDDEDNISLLLYPFPAYTPFVPFRPNWERTIGWSIPTFFVLFFLLRTLNETINLNKNVKAEKKLINYNDLCVEVLITPKIKYKKRKNVFICYHLLKLQ